MTRPALARCALIAFAAFAHASMVAAQAPNANACATARLGKRSSHAMAFDRNLGRVVLFGGSSDDPADRLPGTLWSWDGARWQCVSADGPPGRADAFLAFDDARGRLVLFGGRQFLPERRMRAMLDTWEFDGRRWTLVDTAGPGPRIHGPVAYDVARRRVVVHGGADTAGIRRDTWEWTGIQWREVPLRVPQDGISNSLFTNGVRGLVLLIAVRDSASACAPMRRAAMFEVRADSLVPLGVADRDVCLSPHAPATVAPSGFLYYSGWMPNKPAESWTWIDGRWRATETAPPRRRGAAAAYDERRRRVVLFGGNDDNGLRGDLWEWDGTRWREIPE